MKWNISTHLSILNSSVSTRLSSRNQNLSIFSPSSLQ